MVSDGGAEFRLNSADEFHRSTLPGLAEDVNGEEGALAPSASAPAAVRSLSVHMHGPRAVCGCSSPTTHDRPTSLADAERLRAFGHPPLERVGIHG